MVTHCRCPGILFKTPNITSVTLLTRRTYRQPGQGGDADEVRDLRAELLAAEAAHFAKRNGGSLPPSASTETDTSAAAAISSTKRPLEISPSEAADGRDGEEDGAAKRRRILEESRGIDADSEDGSGNGSSSDEEEDDDDSDDDDDDDSEDDEDAELRRELEKIKRERAEKREREERERAAAEEAERERDIALGNPLLNPKQFNIKRRWDDDVVFKNQARGTEEKGKQKEFINDLLRSDFHKRFMSKYVR
ncbi:Pre-mRNA-splicing factor Cwf15/Cwc15 [Xylariaceae sp. FL0594]|nr:Pre-mRNA-splicing factor Cwf15/Cwc15 [Xylariaceae sp. FL0594]